MTNWEPCFRHIARVGAEALTLSRLIIIKAWKKKVGGLEKMNHPAYWICTIRAIKKNTIMILFMWEETNKNIFLIALKLGNLGENGKKKATTKMKSWLRACSKNICSLHERHSPLSSSPEGCSIAVGRLWKSPATERISHEILYPIRKSRDKDIASKSTSFCLHGWEILYVVFGISPKNKTEENFPKLHRKIRNFWNYLKYQSRVQVLERNVLTRT